MGTKCGSGSLKEYARSCFPLSLIDVRRKLARAAANIEFRPSPLAAGEGMVDFFCYNFFSQAGHAAEDVRTPERTA